MGLGLFIAKTLLERSGARLAFANAEPAEAPPADPPDPPEFARPSGAVVTITWPRARVSPEAFAAAPLDANAPVTG
jgi:two-component system sensor histidine kinase RegB